VGVSFGTGSAGFTGPTVEPVQDSDLLLAHRYLWPVCETVSAGYTGPTMSRCSTDIYFTLEARDERNHQQNEAARCGTMSSTTRRQRQLTKSSGIKSFQLSNA